MRSGASICQFAVLSVVPRGARISGMQPMMLAVGACAEDGPMVHVVDATAERWDDLVEVFGQRGAAVSVLLPVLPVRRQLSRARRRHQPQCAARPVGHHAYRRAGARRRGRRRWAGATSARGRPTRGSCAPRCAQATADEDGLWSVTCFVVRVGHRRQGVSTALLAGALDLARRRGARTVEAYPVDTAVKKASSADLYWGALALYERAGFAEVARPAPSRAVVRLEL